MRELLAGPYGGTLVAGVLLLVMFASFAGYLWVNRNSDERGPYA